MILREAEWLVTPRSVARGGRRAGKAAVPLSDLGN